MLFNMFSTQMNANLYGVHPYYLCTENVETGSSHGVLLLNSNAMGEWGGEYKFLKKRVYINNNNNNNNLVW